MDAPAPKGRGRGVSPIAFSRSPCLCVPLHTITYIRHLMRHLHIVLVLQNKCYSCTARTATAVQLQRSGCTR